MQKPFSLTFVCFLYICRRWAVFYTSCVSLPFHLAKAPLPYRVASLPFLRAHDTLISSTNLSVGPICERSMFTQKTLQACVVVLKCCNSSILIGFSVCTTFNAAGHIFGEHGQLCNLCASDWFCAMIFWGLTIS